MQHAIVQYEITRPENFIIAKNLIPYDWFSTQLRSILKDDKNFTTWKLTTKSFSETLVLNYITDCPSDCVARYLKAWLTYPARGI